MNFGSSSRSPFSYLCTADETSSAASRRTASSKESWISTVLLVHQNILFLHHEVKADNFWTSNSKKIQKALSEYLRSNHWKIYIPFSQGSEKFIPTMNHPGGRYFACGKIIYRVDFGEIHSLPGGSAGRKKIKSSRKMSGIVLFDEFLAG